MCLSSRLARILAVVAAISVMASGAEAQIRGGITPNEADIIRRFTEAESRLREARTSYMFKQDGAHADDGRAGRDGRLPSRFRRSSSPTTAVALSESRIFRPRR